MHACWSTQQYTITWTHIYGTWISYAPDCNRLSYSVGYCSRCPVWWSLFTRHLLELSRWLSRILPSCSFGYTNQHQLPPHLPWSVPKVVALWSIWTHSSTLEHVLIVYWTRGGSTGSWTEFEDWRCCMIAFLSCLTFTLPIFRPILRPCLSLPTLVPQGVQCIVC